MNRDILIFIAIAFSILLVGCSSIEDHLAKTENVTSEAFRLGAKGINVEESTFTYYLPGSIERTSSDGNNIILTEGKQTYILFVNPLEAKTSHIVYESSLLIDEDYLLNKTYENEDRFGFVHVLELEEGQYQVTVGVGGAKLTTVTKKNNIAESAEKMMLIANSVRLKP